MITIDSKDIEILLIIQEDPLAPISTVAKRIGMSNSNTSERLNRLMNEKKAFKGVHADLNLPSLGLEIYDFFYRVKSQGALKALEEKLCYYHPYVLYRGRCYGNYSGLFIQYRIPKDGLDFLIKLSDILIERNFIIDYDYIVRNLEEKSVSIKSALNYWNSETQRWIFDWKSWKINFKSITDVLQSHPKPATNILSNLTSLDIQLLAALTLDARRKNVDIMRTIGIDDDKQGSAQRISRHLAFLKEKAISDYRVFLNWEYFDLYQTILIKGCCVSKIARKLRNYLSLENNSEGYQQFPFESVFFLTKKGFLWYLRAPPAHISELVDFIWEICPNHEIFWIDYKYSEYYGLWAETFDIDKKQWKLDHNFLIADVVKELPKV
jgi:DNA-binding Lrp family transcriptional regulator